MKKLIPVLLMVCSVFSYGQKQGQAKIDSLQAVLKTAKEDTNKVNILNNLAWEIKSIKPDTSIILSTQALQLAEKVNWPLGIGRSYNQLGWFYYIKGNYDPALEHYSKALAKCDEIESDTTIPKFRILKLKSAILGNLGSIYINQGDNPKALDYYTKALKIGEELEDKNGMATNLGNIGIIYFNQGDYPMALDYYLKALKIKEELGDKIEIAKTTGNIGNVYKEQGDYAKALEYYLKALKMAEALGQKQSQLEILINIGIVYSDQGDYPKALDHYFKTLKISEELGLKRHEAAIFGNIGNVYKSQGDYPKALDYCFKALKISEELGLKNSQETIFGNIGNVYQIQADYPKAFEYYFKALKMAEELADKNGISTHLCNIGVVYYDQGDYTKALDYYFKALKIAEELGIKKNIIAILGNIGSVYKQQGDQSQLKGNTAEADPDYINALDYDFKALKMAEELDDKRSQTINLGNIGMVYIKQNKLSDADKYLHDALSLATELKALDLIKSVNEYLSELYTKKGDWKKAHDYYKQSITARDSMNNEETAKKQTRLEMNYDFDKKQAIEKVEHEKELAVAAVETEKKAKEIELLNKEKDIQGLKLKDQESQINQQSLIAEKKDNDLKLLNQSKEIQSLELQNSESNLVQQKLQTKTKEKEVQLLNKDSDLQLKEIEQQKLTRNAYAGAGIALFLLSGGLYRRYQHKQRTNRELEEKNAIITKEKDRSEELLLNILPYETAQELKEKGSSDAKMFDDVTIMFTDFKDFTKITETLSPSELVAEIDYYFKAFDNIIGKYNIEKIKTIGDSYMAAGGLPVPNKTNAKDVVRAAMEIDKFIAAQKLERIKEGKPVFEVRIGIHTGPVVAGIVGIKKFAYDIWGDAVNIASRMQSSGAEGKVNISGSTYDEIKDEFKCFHRGKVEAKNKGMIDMYFVEGTL